MNRYKDRLINGSFQAILFGLLLDWSNWRIKGGQTNTGNFFLCFKLVVLETLG